MSRYTYRLTKDLHLYETNSLLNIRFYLLDNATDFVAPRLVSIAEELSNIGLYEHDFGFNWTFYAVSKLHDMAYTLDSYKAYVYVVIQSKIGNKSPKYDLFDDSKDGLFFALERAAEHVGYKLEAIRKD